MKVVLEAIMVPAILASNNFKLNVVVVKPKSSFLVVAKEPQ